MSKKVTLRLMRYFRQRWVARSDDYYRGRSLGQAWAADHIVPDSDQIPFTPDLRDTPFNLGVVDGVAAELRRFADQLTNSPQRSAVPDPSMRVAEPEGESEGKD